MILFKASSLLGPFQMALCLLLLPCLSWSVTHFAAASSSSSSSSVDPWTTRGKLPMARLFNDDSFRGPNEEERRQSERGGGGNEFMNTLMDSHPTLKLPRLRTLSSGGDNDALTRASGKIGWHGRGAANCPQLKSYCGSTPFFQTYDCKNQSGYYDSTGNWISPKCDLISNSSIKIITEDQQANDAHNHAIDVYEFYKTWFNFDLMTDVPKVIGYDHNFAKSYVHYDGVDYSDQGSVMLDGLVAQMDGLAYDNGDGVSWTSASKCLDRVAWAYSLSLAPVYAYPGWWESAALSFGFANIVAAAVDRLSLEKNSGDTWAIGEDCDLDSSDGLGWLNMSAGTLFGMHISTHYDERNRETPLGIVEYWFYLMVVGGKHPKSNITVPPLDPDFDQSIAAGAKIFFEAITMCIPKTPDFFAARSCTEERASEAQKVSVTKAWDAVGITSPKFENLTSELRLTGLTCGLIGETFDERFFLMKQTVEAGKTVTCRLKGLKLDLVPNLYVKFGRRPEGNNDIDDCYSNNLINQRSFSGKALWCTTKPANRTYSDVYITIQAWAATTDMTLECFVNDNCKTKNKLCTSTAECCGSFVCDAKNSTKKRCKPCIDPCPSNSLFCSGHNCQRTSQCCKKENGSQRRCNKNHRCSGN